METIFIGIVGFLIVLAIFDLVFGVSNDAVNFINSAIGSKAASFKTIIAIAAIGVFAGAALSNGMMDIARQRLCLYTSTSYKNPKCLSSPSATSSAVCTNSRWDNKHKKT